MSNEALFSAIHSITGNSALLDRVIVFCSDTLGILLLLGLVFFLVFHKDTDRAQGVRDIFVVLGAALAAYLIAKILKYFIVSPRPFEVLTDMHALYTHGGGDSMPSGHATFYMSLAATLFFYHKRIAWAYLVGALVIGLSRIAVGVHWPFDILVGFLIGGVVGVSTYLFFQYSHIGQKALEVLSRLISRVIYFR